jgi:hypothetical protein
LDLPAAGEIVIEGAIDPVDVGVAQALEVDTVEVDADHRVGFRAGDGRREERGRGGGAQNKLLHAYPH